MVADINVCFIRESEFEALGGGAVLDKLLMSVHKDLAHSKEHARWLQRAQEWERLGRPRFALPRTAELRGFEHWVLDSAAKGLEPPLTPLHHEFLRAGTKRARLSRALWASVALAVLLTVLGLSGFSAFKAVEAKEQKDEANDLRVKAVLARDSADLEARPCCPAAP